MHQHYTTIEKLLSCETKPQKRVEHFFYFNSETDVNACMLKLLALGFTIDSIRDSNEKVSRDSSDMDEDDNSDAINFKLDLTFGDDITGPADHFESPWSMMVSANHCINEGLQTMHQALDAIARSCLGIYDGHGYIMDDFEEE